MTAKIDLHPDDSGFSNAVELLHRTATRRQARGNRPMKLVIYSDGQATEATDISLVDDVLAWAGNDGNRGKVPIRYLDRVTIWRL